MQKSQYKVYSTTHEAWHAMYHAILGAEQSIYWEMYIFLDDDIGTSFFRLLMKKARQGVTVTLIIDPMGSFGVSRKRIEDLRAAGVDIRLFVANIKRLSLWKRLWARTHRKILIVDEAVGFIGGVNIDKRMQMWRDFVVQIHGKAVHSLLRSFAKSYIMSGGAKRAVRHLLRYRFRVQRGLEEVEFIYDEGASHRSRARKKYTEALLRARERVILFSPYYFPDKKFLYALWRARKRGVRVDLLIPFRSDLRLVTYAAYSWFSFMKKLGVHVHLSEEMMHGKGVVVDDDWAMIGSSNLDSTSFVDNYEANVRISEKLFVQKIKSTLLSWMHSAKKLDGRAWEDWRKRGFIHRAMERCASFLYRLWHWRARL